MRLIDADKLEKDFVDCSDKMPYPHLDMIHISTAKMLIESAENVDPVHAAGGCYCKECEFWKTEDCVMDDWYYTEVLENDFCSRGVKRDGDN